MKCPHFYFLFILNIQCSISSIVIYMKKFRNSDWVRAARLIPNSAITVQCVITVQICVISAHFLLISVITFWRGKNLHGKNKYGGQGCMLKWILLWYCQ